VHKKVYSNKALSNLKINLSEFIW